MLLETHDQGVNPGIENDVAAFKTHLRRVARRIILNVGRRRYHRAGNTQTLGNVALHLGTQYQLGLQFGDRPLNGEVVVGNKRLEPIFCRQRTHIAGALSAVGAQTHHLKTHFVPRHARGRQCVGPVGKNEDPLAGQISGVHRTAVPGQAALADCIGIQIEPQRVDHLGNEIAGGTPTQRHRGNDRLLELALEPIAGELAHLGCQVHVGIRLRNSQ